MGGRSKKEKVKSEEAEKAAVVNGLINGVLNGNSILNGSSSPSSSPPNPSSPSSKCNAHISPTNSHSKELTGERVKEKEDEKEDPSSSLEAVANTQEPECSWQSEVSVDEAVERAAEALADLELVAGIRISQYQDERQMEAIMRLISRDLSEPYSIYTYRYFIHNWPHLCYLAHSEEDEAERELVGAIVCKLDRTARESRRGYIAMLAVDQRFRRRQIGSRLVRRAIVGMRAGGCDEVVLETEVTNTSSLRLYQKLGFVRDKRLFRYYLNGVDAFRLKLWLTPPVLPFQFPFYPH